jgi:hypothetical protein
VVELIEVPLSYGPTLVAALTDAGIEVTDVESFDVVTKATTNMRLMVRRRDLLRAFEVVHDWI